MAVDYDTRQRTPVILPADVAHDVWSELKSMRDDADQRGRIEMERSQRLSVLLRRMKASGGADHLPTLDEVQAAYRGQK